MSAHAPISGNFEHSVDFELFGGNEEVLLLFVCKVSD